jgi:hypothetical protein
MWNDGHRTAAYSPERPGLYRDYGHGLSIVSVPRDTRRMGRWMIVVDDFSSMAFVWPEGFGKPPALASFCVSGFRYLSDAKRFDALRHLRRTAPETGPAHAFAWITIRRDGRRVPVTDHFDASGLQDAAQKEDLDYLSVPVFDTAEYRCPDGIP